MGAGQRCRVMGCKSFTGHVSSPKEGGNLPKVAHGAGVRGRPGRPTPSQGHLHVEGPRPASPLMGDTTDHSLRKHDLWLTDTDPCRGSQGPHMNSKLRQVITPTGLSRLTPKQSGLLQAPAWLCSRPWERGRGADQRQVSPDTHH